MRAQMTKNAVIVPGRRQGRLLPQARRRPTATSCAPRSSASTSRYVAGCSTLTDNLVDGEVVHPDARARARRATTPTSSSPPTRARRRSPTPPTRSREEYGFWLGDAFASGGSTGYDHKALGITARGAWESVKRHFSRARPRRRDRPVHGRRDRRHVGRRVRQRDAALATRSGSSPPTTTATSSSTPTRIRRVGFAERKRLFELPGSSWDDYDRAQISEGGGVWPRTREVDPALAAGARGARRRGRAARARPT